jgi:hypothetical protein
MKLPATLLSAFATVVAMSSLVWADAAPRLIPLGCSFDGGLSWLAVGKTSADVETLSFRVEVPDVDLERVDASISPSAMDPYAPYQLGPVVGPINVAATEIAPREVNGVPNGNVVTVHFNILTSYSKPSDFRMPEAISYVLVLNNKSTGCQRRP